jgi:anti-sigma regulatory factor (Ser/Thr protein kinase)
METLGARRLSVRLAADPGGVPGARRFVVEGVTAWGCEPMADVAELVVSELAANAALHSGARFMYISLVAHRDGAVRVAVEDDGPVGAEAVLPHQVPSAGDLEGWRGQATTGRGLAIVSVLADEWGVEPTAHGKRVWADLVDPDANNDVRLPLRADGPIETEATSGLPPGWVLVRLAGCPVELSLRQDQHLDELVRELQLLAANRGNTHAQEIAAQISALLTSPAHARLTGRRIAEHARSQGLSVVDIDMAMPREFSPLVQQLEAAVSRADILCEQDQLLALASPPELRELRAWMTHQIVSQAEHDEPPVPWTTWHSRLADQESPLV